jgi:mannose-P-dolichol utilization defect protein 1
LGIVAGSAIVKVPQIFKIVSSQSAEGLSFSSYLMETISYAVTLAYNIRHDNPFSTYGETAFVTVQNIVIMALLIIFSKRYSMALPMLAILVAQNFLLYSAEIVDEKMLVTIQSLTIPLVIFSRVPQIASNLKNGNTGQLSAFTVFLFFGGSAARVFTTIQEVNDKVILTGFALATLVNGILAFQMLYYWNSGPRKGATISKGKKRN